MKTRSIIRYASSAAPFSLILIASIVVTHHPKSPHSSRNVNATVGEPSKPTVPPLTNTAADLHVTVDGQPVPVEKNGTTHQNTASGSVTVTNSEDSDSEAGTSNGNSVNLHLTTDTSNSSTHSTTTIRHNATTSNRSRSQIDIQTNGDSNINVSK